VSSSPNDPAAGPEHEPAGPSGPAEGPADALPAAYDVRTTQLYEARAALADAVSVLAAELREVREDARYQAKVVARLEDELRAALSVIEEQRNMKVVRWTRWPRSFVYGLRGRRR
jgi:hypothetical protein